MSIDGDHFLRVAAWSAAASFALSTGCADKNDSPSEPEKVGYSTGTCPSGKCDGFASRIRDLYDDMTTISLEDLTALGVGLANDPLNDVLGDVPYVDIEISKTSLFGDPREVFEQDFVHDIDALHAGLTDHLGESAFATRITDIRRRILASTSNTVWAESHFRLGGSVNFDWSTPFNDDIVGTVGFHGRPEVETVLIAPYEGNLEAVVSNPLKSVRASRGWILPRGTSDIVKMVPGEALSMRARGTLGINFGVGIPIVLATLADYITLNSRFSAAARVGISGDLDVQLVRGEGQLAYVDVGVENHEMKGFSLAYRTGWGVAGSQR